jgi:hypothetical protein
MGSSKVAGPFLSAFAEDPANLSGLKPESRFMRPSRSFRPSAPLSLEGRVVPSATAAHAGAPGVLSLSDVETALRQRAIRLSAAEIAQSNASDVPFGISTSDTIHAGTPVAEQLTTTYEGGGAQTESLLKVPNSSNNTVTTYKTINLRNSGGTETVVDTETFSGGTMPFSGTDNTHTITTTLPGGSIQTETENEVIDGPKTVVNATIHEAGGGVETWMSVNIKRGTTTVANKTITEPDGSVERQKIVTTHYGDLDYTTRSTTIRPGSILVSSSATNVIRVQPPSG